MSSPADHPVPAEGRIDTEVRGHVLLIGINRPAKRNGWTVPMFRQLAEAYTRLDDDPSLRVGVLHALGDHFTAGLDLPAIAPYMQRGEKAVPYGQVEPHDFGLPGYRRRTKPMVAAVKGICFTVGIELMLGADIVVAGQDCRFSQMEVQRGIMATGGATLRMAERAGLGNAMLHLLTADEFGADEALRLNFVQKVVPNAEVLDEALRIAERIAAQARRGGHAAERAEGGGTRPTRGSGRFHRNAEAAGQQRRRGRRRARLRRKTGRTVSGAIRPLLPPTAAGRTSVSPRIRRRIRRPRTPSARRCSRTDGGARFRHPQRSPPEAHRPARAARSATRRPARRNGGRRGLSS